MSQPSEDEREELRVRYGRRRREDSRRWLAVLGVTLLSGTVGWLWTGNVDWIVVFCFLSAYPLFNLTYTYCYLLNPRADPLTIRQRLKREARGRQTLARSVARTNGITLAVAGMIMFPVGLFLGAEEHGFWGAVIGGSLGLAWFVAGLGAYMWSKGG